MAFQRDPEAGRKAAAWLAVAFTFTAGAMVCSFIILAFADNPRQPFLVLGGILGGALLLIWLLSARKDRTDFRGWLLFWRRVQEPPDPAELYQPRRRRRSSRRTGGNQPPTVDSVREIAETHARWVPHGSAPPRNRPDHGAS